MEMPKNQTDMDVSHQQSFSVIKYNKHGVILSMYFNPHTTNSVIIQPS